MTKQIPEHIAAMIRKDVPPPAKSNQGRKLGTGRYEAAVWLGVGDSFFVPSPKLGTVKAGVSTLMQRRKIFAHCFAYREEVVDGATGVRVWRTK